MAGILVQWYLPVSVRLAASICVITFLLAFFFNRLSSYQKFRVQWLQTTFILIGLFFSGTILLFLRDERNNDNWFAPNYKMDAFLQVVLLEKPVEKNRSFKANAKVVGLIQYDSVRSAGGQIIIYFKKDSSVSVLKAGDQLLFGKAVQEIKNSGNPGSFNYKQYALFNGITHQVYLTEKDFVVLGKPPEKTPGLWLYQTRASILSILKKYIHGPKELGLAEALLIGYRDDLDKELLQSYSNTGVVHVIAVSGMHLALVFWLLNLLLQPLLKRKNTKWLHPVLILCILWLFTLLAGGAASVVRAAVMFSFILLGKTFGRNASIYNTLAASAFFLLCYDPYWLWDAGFQLSYAAVLSIVIFYKPIYNLFFVQNPLLNSVWQLCAVSIAAQVLTTPIAAYLFHQFPVYFLITNLLAVPISSFVLIGELLLVFLSPLNSVAAFIGNILSRAIWWMNSIIENLSRYPFSIWSGLNLNIAQVLLLYLTIIGFATGWMQKRKWGLWLGLASVLALFSIRLISFQKADEQQRLIVYNIPRATAIDFISGRNHFLLADSLAFIDASIQKNVLVPSVVMHRLKESRPLPNLQQNNRLFIFNNRSILLVNTPVEEIDIAGKVDVAVLSGNPKLYMNQFIRKIQPKQVVIDASSPTWKVNYWQRDCDSLRIPCHYVVDKGAFVMKF